MIKLGPEPIDAAALLACVADPAHGGQDLFIGTVRSTHEGRNVVAVTYEAFEPLARKVLADIVSEAEKKHGAKIAAVHRLGRLKVGQAGVAIAAGSPHRAEAFAACRQVIEQIKKRLPVWKKEHYDTGDSAWLAGCSLAGHR